MQRKATLVVLIPVLFLGSALAFGQKVNGMITNRTGDTMTVKGPAGTSTVVLTDDTKTVDKRGLFGLEKQQLTIRAGL